jgi:hypothetical protein
VYLLRASHRRTSYRHASHRRASYRRASHRRVSHRRRRVQLVGVRKFVSVGIPLCWVACGGVLRCPEWFRLLPTINSSVVSNLARIRTLIPKAQIAVGFLSYCGTRSSKRFPPFEVLLYSMSWSGKNCFCAFGVNVRTPDHRAGKLLAAVIFLSRASQGHLSFRREVVQISFDFHLFP